MEFLAQAVGSIVACMCNNMAPGSECDYICHPTKEIELLKNKKTKVVAKQKDVMTKLDIALREGKVRTSEVQHWLDNFDKFIADFDGIEKKSRTRLNGGFLNCHSRLILGREIPDMNNDASDLLEKLDRLSADSLAVFVPSIGLTRPTVKLRGEHVKKTRQAAWDMLMSDEINIIGVYGMGGMGKTTMMESIYIQLVKGKNHIDRVV